MPEGSEATSLIELIVRWHALIEEGASPTPEELCETCPDMVPLLRAYVQTQLQGQTETETAADGSQPAQFSLGRYRLQRIVGCGGFGQVWQAYDPDLQRLVAVKIARPDRLASPGLKEQFIREARRLAQLSQQPGIVSVYDVGRVGGLCFIVSELMSGGSLAERMESAGSMPVAEAVVIVADVAESLHEAHLADIVHRDIKPANVLFDGDGRAHVADFGLATSEEEQLIERRGVRGTWSYMSPEQARGEAHLVDGRTDIYSLGVMLYHLLTGRLPYVASSKSEYLRQVIEREPRPPRSVDDAIAPELERICLKCLARSMNDRYTTAADLARDLRSWLAAQQTGGQRRRLTPWTLSAASLIVIAVVVGMAMAGWHWSRPRSTRMWQDLGKNPPVPVLVADGATWDFSADRREMRIDSPVEFTFLSLGRTQGPLWRFECNLAGEPPQAGENLNFERYGAGLFFGLRDERAPNGEPLRRMQAVFLLRDRRGASYHMHRRTIELRQLPDASWRAFLLASAEALDVDQQPIGDFVLEIGPSGLEIVAWRGQPVRRLVMPGVNDRTTRDDYLGEYGVFAFGGAATFGHPRFKQLGDD